MSKIKKECEMVLPENEKAERYTTRNGKKFMYVPFGVAVYDNRGKRKIGKNGRTPISERDLVIWDDVEYVVSSFTDTHVVLKKK